VQNDESVGIDQQGKLSNCPSFSKSEPLTAQLPEKRRLSAIRISSAADDTNVNKFKKANFSFAGDENVVPQIAYERNISSDSISLFVFTNLTEELSSLSIKLTSDKSFNLCQIELFALPDQCGHPEIPINGTVTWQRGYQNATYSCQEGYYLEQYPIISFSAETRICEKGKWSGSEPLCELF
jgi:Sushi repeat (SCR repeat)